MNLKQVLYVNLWNQIALLYTLPSNTFPKDSTAITRHPIATSSIAKSFGSDCHEPQLFCVFPLHI